MFLRRMSYYTRSLPTLFTGLRNKHTLWRLIGGSRIGDALEIELMDPQLRFKVRNLLDVWILKEVCLDHSYFPSSIETEPDWVFIDIGGCFGAFAVDAALSHPDGMVYTFEPFRPSFDLLTENLRLNGVSNVRAFPYAVSGVPGTSRLYLDPRSPLCHSTVPPDTQVGLWPSTKVQATCLDSIMRENGLDRCDVLKIDCEGGEYEILFGASDSTLSRLRFVTLEYHDEVTEYRHGDLVEFLTDRSFDVSVIPSPVHPWLGQIVAMNTEFSRSANKHRPSSSVPTFDHQVPTSTAA